MFFPAGLALTSLLKVTGMVIVWELQRGAWTCPFSTMEVRSEARWKRFPSPDLPSDHICCVTEREQNRGFCNLMPLQHQTTGTNKATSHELERHKNSRKRGHDHAVGPFSSLHFVKLTFRPGHPKQWSVKTWILPLWHNIIVWNEAPVFFSGEWLQKEKPQPAFKVCGRP